jgi:hypothetical protein
VLFGFEDGGVLCTLVAASYPERVLALRSVRRVGQVLHVVRYTWGWTTDEAEEWWQPSSAIGYGAFLRSQ